MSTHSSASNRAKRPSRRCGGQLGPSPVPGARVKPSSPGGRTPLVAGVNAPGVMAASAPAMISRIPCSPGASTRWPTGASRLAWCAGRVRLGGLPEREGARAARARAGAGGCARPPSPLRPLVSGRAPWQRMRSSPRLVRRAKRTRAGSHRGDAAPVVVARSASRAGAMRTKTGPP
jgi:hypothetical protein